jgi:hypothetical protein
MTELSPQTQAVLNAWESEWSKGSFYHEERSVAAALRAAVQELKYFGITEKNILAIAAELEESAVVTDPITPPPELVQQWLKERTLLESQPLAHTYLATRAAQYGADQELEACIANIHTMCGKDRADWLRLMRRPKPPSLKEQALTNLSEIGSHYIGSGAAKLIDTIRRALEAAND